MLRFPVLSEGAEYLVMGVLPKGQHTLSTLVFTQQSDSEATSDTGQSPSGRMFEFDSILVSGASFNFSLSKISPW